MAIHDEAKLNGQNDIIAFRDTASLFLSTVCYEEWRSCGGGQWDGDGVVIVVPDYTDDKGRGSSGGGRRGDGRSLWSGLCCPPVYRGRAVMPGYRRAPLICN